MTKLAEVQARFSAAIDALDKAIEQPPGGLRQGAKLKAELNALKNEREALLGRIAALEEEARVLAGLTEEVEDRLDETIAEIRDVLAQH
jgi:predicted nuclease with TOPRIM domain